MTNTLTKPSSTKQTILKIEKIIERIHAADNDDMRRQYVLELTQCVHGGIEENRTCSTVPISVSAVEMLDYDTRANLKNLTNEQKQRFLRFSSEETLRNAGIPPPPPPASGN